MLFTFLFSPSPSTVEGPIHPFTYLPLNLFASPAVGAVEPSPSTFHFSCRELVERSSIQKHELAEPYPPLRGIEIRDISEDIR